MSAAKKIAKFVLVGFGMLVLLFAGLVAYLYMNMNELVKDFAQEEASDVLGVPVTIGGVDINAEELRISVSDIVVANPEGFKNKNSIIIDNVIVEAESFVDDVLTLALVKVEGVNVNFEVSDKGVNLRKLKAGSERNIQKSVQQKNNGVNSSDVRVVVNRLSLTGAKLTPSVTILSNHDIGVVNVPDIYLENIGRKEGGVLAQEVMARIMGLVLKDFNKSANSAGFIRGESLKDLKKSYKKEVEKFKKGFESLKGVFD